jgi:hypothetical protein
MRGLWLLLLLVVSALTATGCEVVGGIFKAGFWAGTIVVLIVVVGVVFLLTKLRR